MGVKHTLLLFWLWRANDFTQLILLPLHQPMTGELLFPNIPWHPMFHDLHMIFLTWNIFFLMVYLENFSTHHLRQVIHDLCSHPTVQSPLGLHWSHCFTSICPRSFFLFLDLNSLRAETKSWLTPHNLCLISIFIYIVNECRCLVCQHNIMWINSSSCRVKRAWN